jgi:hypothetical protein
MLAAAPIELNLSIGAFHSCRTSEGDFQISCLSQLEETRPRDEPDVLTRD